MFVGTPKTDAAARTLIRDSEYELEKLVRVLPLDEKGETEALFLGRWRGVKGLPVSKDERPSEYTLHSRCMRFRRAW